MSRRRHAIGAHNHSAGRSVRDYRRLPALSLLGVFTVALVVASMLLGVLSHGATAAGSPCQFESAATSVNVAFCESFDAPAGTGNRSAQLNGTLWGVSRQGGFNNIGQGQYDAAVSSLQMGGSCPSASQPRTAYTMLLG